VFNVYLVSDDATVVSEKVVWEKESTKVVPDNARGAHHSLAECSLIVRNSLAADIFLVNSSLVAGFSIQSIRTYHVDIDVENQVGWGGSSR